MVVFQKWLQHRTHRKKREQLLQRRGHYNKLTFCYMYNPQPNFLHVLGSGSEKECSGWSKISSSGEKIGTSVASENFYLFSSPVYDSAYRL